MSRTGERGSRFARALRISNLNDLERGLAHSVNIDGEGSAEILRAIRDFDLIPDGVASEMGLELATSTHKYELALAWTPHDLPVTLHIFVNQKAFPGSHGTFTGGRAFFAVPAEQMKPGANEVAYTLRFLGSGWKFQLWGSEDDAHQRLDSGADPDPDSNKDDRVIQKVTWNVGGA